MKIGARLWCRCARRARREVIPALFLQKPSSRATLQKLLASARIALVHSLEEAEPVVRAIHHSIRSCRARLTDRSRRVARATRSPCVHGSPPEQSAAPQVRDLIFRPHARVTCGAREFGPLRRGFHSARSVRVRCPKEGSAGAALWHFRRIFQNDV